MSTLSLCLCFALGFSIAPNRLGADALQALAGKPDRTAIAARVRTGLEVGTWEDLAAACSRAAEQLGEQSRSAGRLTLALEVLAPLAVSQPALAGRLLADTAREVAADLAFQPLIEADMPAGFPGITPVGEIELKEYPRYRMARTNMRHGRGGRDAGAFWQLFQHIQSNDIAMTAPVQMEYEAGLDGRLREASMAFLYGRVEVGPLGGEGAVQVVDVMPATWVSMGMRGAMDYDSIAAARAELEAWIEANSARYRRAGEMRTQGYNSPMVPRERRYFEVQIPVDTESHTPSRFRDREVPHESKAPARSSGSE